MPSECGIEGVNIHPGGCDEKRQQPGHFVGRDVGLRHKVPEDAWQRHPQHGDGPGVSNPMDKSRGFALPIPLGRISQAGLQGGPSVSPHPDACWEIPFNLNTSMVV
jgi:hypothetical protein